MLRRIACLALFGFLAIGLMSGCGPSYSDVQVKVTLDGTAVEGAAVSFAPVDPKVGEAASGVTDAQGIAKIASSNKSGVQHGEYRVTVSKTEGPAGMSMDPKSATENMAKFAKESGMGGKMMGQPKGGASLKQLLPKNEFTVKVPASGVVPLDLKKN